MRELITREIGPFAKGSPLSNQELDENFLELDTRTRVGNLPLLGIDSEDQAPRNRDLGEAAYMSKQDILGDVDLSAIEAQLALKADTTYVDQQISLNVSGIQSWVSDRFLPLVGGGQLEGSMLFWNGGDLGRWAAIDPSSKADKSYADQIKTTADNALPGNIQMNGKPYQKGYDFNNWSTLYDVFFIEKSSSSGGPNLAGSQFYRFFMGAGDVSGRGFELVGDSDSNLSSRAFGKPWRKFWHDGNFDPNTKLSSLTAGTVTTGAAGSNASLTITGSAPNQTINFTIPKGDTGAQGPKGDTGAQGPQGPAGPSYGWLDAWSSVDPKKALTNRGVALVNSNLDTLSSQDSEIFGYHPGNGANVGDPPGRPGYGTMLLFSAASFITEMIFPDSGSRETGIFHRTRYEPNGWGSWARIWDSANFDPDSLMPKSGGTFTGDITVAPSGSPSTVTVTPGHSWLGYYPGTNRSYLHGYNKSGVGADGTPKADLVLRARGAGNELRELTLRNDNVLTWNGNDLGRWATQDPASYLPKSGGTLTGTLSGPRVSATLHNATGDMHLFAGQAAGDSGYDPVKGAGIVLRDPTYTTPRLIDLIGGALWWNGSDLGRWAAVDPLVKFDAPLCSQRDFPNGTFIRTDIDYSQPHGDPFVLEISGNSYGSQYPMLVNLQGYLYDNTIINHGGFSVGTFIPGIIALNLGSKLCFWFPRQSYWFGYTVRCYVPQGGFQRNRVVSIENSDDPGGSKRVSFDGKIKYSWDTSNFDPGSKYGYLSTPTFQSDVYINSADGSSGIRRVHCNSGLIGFLNTSGSWTFRTDNDGGCVGGTFRSESDLSLKSDLAEIVSPLSSLVELTGYTYKKRGVDYRVAGLIANDVEVVLPEAVQKDEDGIRSLDYNAVVALLVNAVKELKAEVDALKGVPT